MVEAEIASQSYSAVEFDLWKNVVHVVVSVEAAQYRDDKAGYDAYVIRQYMEPQLVLDDAIDKICL